MHDGMRATLVAEGDGGGHGRSGAGLVPRAAAPRAVASRGAAHRRRVGRAPADRRGGQLHHHAAQAPPRLPERGHGPGEVRRLAAGGLAAHRAQADPGARILVRRMQTARMENVCVSQSCMVSSVSPQAPQSKLLLSQATPSPITRFERMARYRVRLPVFQVRSRPSA